MLWLPLFMESAWAMNMQMQLENKQAQTTYVAEKTHMNCYENSDKSQQNQKTSSHQCAVCGMCALVNGTANFNTAPVINLASSQSSTPRFFYVAFTSQDYPPSYKPPILV
jgi:hypothetical protein